MSRNYSQRYDNEISYFAMNPENRPLITKTDIKGNIIFTNNIFRKITGYSKEELTGKPHSIVRHPDMPKAIFEEMWNHILNKKKWYGYLKNKTKDGKTYWTEVVIEPLIDENGNIEAFMSYQKFVKHNIKKLYNHNYKILKLKEVVSN